MNIKFIMTALEYVWSEQAVVFFRCHHYLLADRSQDFLCKHLLQWNSTNQTHNAALDAVKSMRLYKKWLDFQADPVSWQHQQV